MDLKALFSLMNQKKYYYFSGSIDKFDDNLYVGFSTGYMGHGNSVDLEINNSQHKITYYNESNSPRQIELDGLSDSELFLFVKNNVV